MPGNAQPLVGNQPIVNSDGTPNAYFTKWAQQRQIDITSGITADQAQEIAQELIDTWAAMRQIIAGTGLDGGGDLSNDVTLDLADTAVSPGTYGDATNSAQITVDQQGRITNVVDVPITGGGGGGEVFISLDGGNLAVSTSADKYKGAILIPDVNITLTDTFARGTLVSGQIYQSFIVTVSASNVVTALIATSNTVTITPTSAITGSIRTTYPSPVTLVAGTRYAIMTTRTDGGGTLLYSGVFWSDGGTTLSVGAPILYFGGARNASIAVGTALTIPGNIFCQSILGTPTF